MLVNRRNVMLSRENTTRKYFIFALRKYFNDEYSRLDSRKFDSILYLLEDYLVIYNEICKHNNKNLMAAFNALIDNIVYYFEKTPLKKVEDFREDIESIISLLKNNDKKDKKGAYYIISAFDKKIRNLDLINVWINILQEKINDFADADIVLDCFVSELLYKGYSLEFLRQWWFQKYDKDVLTEETEFFAEIEKLKELGIEESTEFKVLIDLQLPEKIVRELEVKNDIFINDIKYSLEDKVDEFPQFGKNESVLSTSILSIDKYKAIEIAVEPIEKYIQIYSVIDNSINDKAVKRCKVTYPEEYYKELHNRQSNLRKINQREIDDIKDFIELRDEIRAEDLSLENTTDLENVINIIQKSSEFTKENRLLNLWSCMENLVRFYDGNSIIAKILDIVPKIVTMYILKQKMNQLWDRLIPLMKTPYEELKSCDRNDGTKKYDRDKFLKFLLSEETSLELHNRTEENIVTQRCVLEIHRLLKENKRLLQRVELELNSTIHNLNAIYRLRNNLVHNGGLLTSNMEYHTRRLQMYLNNTLGIIIFHMKRNPKTSIVEILYSVDSTYERFNKKIKVIQEKLKSINCNNKLN